MTKLELFTLYGSMFDFCSFSYDGYKCPFLKNVLPVHLDMIPIVFELFI